MLSLFLYSSAFPLSNSTSRCSIFKCTCNSLQPPSPAPWCVYVLGDHSGAGGVFRDRVSIGAVSRTQDGSGGAAVRPRARFWCVCEGQCGGVDDTVVSHKRYGNLDRLPHPSPTLTEGRNVRYYTEHALSTPAEQWKPALGISSGCSQLGHIFV